MSVEYDDTLMLVHRNVQERAFYKCRSITQLRFNSSVRVVGYYSFFENVNLETVYFAPHGTESIEGWAFAGCNMLEDVELPHSLTKIGENAFYECIRLQSIRLPGCLTMLGQDCFLGTRIQVATIPPSVRKMATAFDPRLKQLRCTGKTLALTSTVKCETVVCPAKVTAMSGDQWHFMLTIPIDPATEFNPVHQLKTQNRITDSIDIVSELGVLQDHRDAILQGKIDPEKLALIYV